MTARFALDPQPALRRRAHRAPATSKVPLPRVHDAETSLQLVQMFGAQSWCQRLELGGLARLAALAEVDDVRDGDAVLEEGQTSRALWLVLSGAVVVSKKDATGEARTLAELGKGAVFGEVSFLDGLPVSATVRAKGDVRVVHLARERLESDAVLAPVKHRIVAELAALIAGRLRALDGNYAETVRAKVDEAEQRRDLGKLFIVTVALFGIGQITQRLITPDISAAAHMAYSWGFLLLIVALVVAFIRVQHAPLAAFGLAFQRAGRSLAEGTAAGLAVLAAFAAWRASNVASGEPTLTFGSIARYTPVEAAFFYALYLPHCFLQELVARGVIQGSLERLLATRTLRAKRWLPMIVTSALFGIFHLHVSTSFALLTFVASLAFGALYLRHRDLAGVTTLHFLLGLGAVAFGLD